MPKGIMGNGGSWSLIEALGVSATWKETSQTNLLMPTLFLLVNTVKLNQSTPNSLPIMPIGIVAYAFTLLWDNLCRNSCIHVRVRVTPRPPPSLPPPEKAGKEDSLCSPTSVLILQKKNIHGVYMYREVASSPSLAVFKSN